jgi:hypothetical protein
LPHRAGCRCSRCRAQRGCERLRSGRKPGNLFFLENRVFRFCEDFVLDRSLAALGSGYNGNAG